MRYKTLFVVCLLLMSVFAAFCVPNASAADKNYLKINANGGGMNNRYVHNGNAYILGDTHQTVSFGISLVNIQYVPAHAGDYLIRNVTAKIVNQRDSNGNQFNILDFSNGENTVKWANPPNVAPHWEQPIAQFSVTTNDQFSADVVPTGAAGTFNLTISFTYEYSLYDTVTFITTWTSATDTDYVYILIDDGLNVAKTVSVFDENNNILDGFHYLYSGTTFQKVGISVTTATGLIGEITATITLDAQTATYISLYQPSAYTSQLGGQIYFKYRANVNDGTPPGRYSASAEVKYTRWYGQTNNKVITAQKVPLEFIVDFTPMLSIMSPASFTVNQGTLATNMTEVTLKNSGNTELTKLKVWIDIGHYFEELGYYYQEPNTIPKVPLMSLQQREKLGKGETWQVDFTGISVFKYLPEGNHRIPLGYSGYYFDDGKAGGSSDFKQTDDSTYVAIKQVPLYLLVIVPFNPHDFQVQSTSSINLGQKMKDISISLSIKNLEDVDVLYTSIMVGTKDQTTSKVLLVNPKNTGSAYLEPATLTVFPAQDTEYFTLNADVAMNATEGYYNLPVTISGTDANTKKPVSTTSSMSVRVNPVPPRLIVTGVQFDPKLVVGGKDFTLTISVKNVGNDVARQVYVNLVEGSNGGASISTDYMPDVAKADAIVNPFSVTVSKILLDTPINPGETKSVTYTVHADKNLVKGKDYQMYVYVDNTDDQARSFSYSTEITLSITGSIPTKPADYSGITNPLLVWIVVIIIVFILAIIFAKMVMKPRRPSRYDEALPSEPMPREHMGPSGTATAAPVATQTVQTAAGAQTFKVCPACHKSVPANQVTCPHCGCAL
jgi:hypothetical protein